MTITDPEAVPVYDRVRGSGPTLVFLHYWGGSARTWNEVARALAGRDLIIIDFRGWSRSSPLSGPYSLHQLARDTLAVIAAEGVTDYAIIGHSMGGKVAQLVASTRPSGLRGLVLVASGPAKPAAEITLEYQEGLAHAYDSDESAANARDSILTATVLPDLIKMQVLEDSRSAAEEARTEWPLNGIAKDITAETQKVNVPTLVLAGENDVVEPSEVLRNNLVPYLSGAEFAVIPRTGHLIPLEAPAETARAIATFVSTE